MTTQGAIKIINVLKDDVLRKCGMDNDLLQQHKEALQYLIQVAEGKMDLTEEEIIEIIKNDEISDCIEFEPNKYKYRMRLAYAIYEAQQRKRGER